MIWTGLGSSAGLLQRQMTRALLPAAMTLTCLVPALAAERPATTEEAADASGVVYRMTEKYTGDIGPDRRAIRVLVH